MEKPLSFKSVLGFIVSYVVPGPLLHPLLLPHPFPSGSFLSVSLCLSPSLSVSLSLTLSLSLCASSFGHPSSEFRSYLLMEVLFHCFSKVPLIFDLMILCIKWQLTLKMRRLCSCWCKATRAKIIKLPDMGFAVTVVGCDYSLATVG